MNLFQTNLFDNVETPIDVNKNKAKKVKAQNVKKKGEEKQKPPADTKQSSNQLDGINVETCILYAGFRTDGRRYYLTDLFTDDEIEKGILKEDGKRQKISAEDIRYRLENGLGIDEAFPEFIKGFSDIRYNKEKNILLPSVSGKKKGTSHFDVPSLCKETLLTFIGIAKHFSEKFGTEVAGDIYQNPETGEFLLRIPPQIVHKYWVEREHDGELQATHLKVCEIHSHHTMAAFPSHIDNEDDIIPKMLYCIVGSIDEKVPHVTCRYFDHFQQRHISVDPEGIFCSFEEMVDAVIPSFAGVIFPQVEVVQG